MLQSRPYLCGVLSRGGQCTEALFKELSPPFEPRPCLHTQAKSRAMKALAQMLLGFPLAHSTPQDFKHMDAHRVSGDIPPSDLASCAVLRVQTSCAAVLLVCGLLSRKRVLLLAIPSPSGCPKRRLGPLVSEQTMLGLGPMHDFVPSGAQESRNVSGDNSVCGAQSTSKMSAKYSLSFGGYIQWFILQAQFHFSMHFVASVIAEQH